MTVRHSMRSLTPAALADEFKRIDKENDRFISKDGMRAFLNSGKCGEIAEHDFEALWAVLDADGNGTVDFLEFCAFMGQCHDDYNMARLDRNSIAVNASSRLSFAEVSARRLSLNISKRDLASSMPEVEEEGDEEDGGP